MSELATKLLAGDRRALARAITLAETSEPAGWDLVNATRHAAPDAKRAAVTGITGPPGAGKSTLISALTSVRRAASRHVGVLSVDPSSPFSHGAVLGDRIRLAEHFLDRHVYIRSMGNRGATGGLSGSTLQAVLLLEAFGIEDVLIETVGVGQTEIAIVDHADTVVLVLVPGSGDAVQALKAGIMEIPDIVVVNKADHEMASTLIRQVRSALSLVESDGRWRPPVLATQASNGDGLEELSAAIDAHRAHLSDEGALDQRRSARLRTEAIASASRRLTDRIVSAAHGTGALADLFASVERREIDPFTAAGRVLEWLEDPVR